jgi:hypothetical protein
MGPTAETRRDGRYRCGLPTTFFVQAARVDEDRDDPSGTGGNEHADFARGILAGAPRVGPWTRRKSADFFPLTCAFTVAGAGVDPATSRFSGAPDRTYVRSAVDRSGAKPQVRLVIHQPADVRDNPRLAVSCRCLWHGCGTPRRPARQLASRSCWTRWWESPSSSAASRRLSPRSVSRFTARVVSS